MRIGEAARESGVTIKAARFYADRGLLGPLRRVGRYRDFDAHHLQRLKIVAHCRSRGFSLGEIHEVMTLLPEEGCPPPEAMLDLVESKLGDLSEQAKALQDQLGRLEVTRAYLRARVADQKAGR